MSAGEHHLAVGYPLPETDLHVAAAALLVGGRHRRGEAAPSEPGVLQLVRQRRPDLRIRSRRIGKKGEFDEERTIPGEVRAATRETPDHEGAHVWPRRVEVPWQRAVDQCQHPVESRRERRGVEVWGKRLDAHGESLHLRPVQIGCAGCSEQPAEEVRDHCRNLTDIADRTDREYSTANIRPQLLPVRTVTQRPTPNALRCSPFAAALLPAAFLSAQARPVFVDGQAQVVPAFADSADWIRERLWVETTFDTDGDGRLDRVHVDVTRPRQTATEGLKVPIVYETSPYFAGTAFSREALWDVRQQVGAAPPPRAAHPAASWDPDRTWISNSEVRRWVPRGFAVVHSESPGTGLSEGCPTVGGPNEELAPKAVIDWLNGRARGFTTAHGSDEVHATWSTGKVGMTGTSYNGTLPVAAATTGVDGLEAIVPIAPNTSYYRYYRSNGLVRHPGGWLGEDIDYLYDFINSGDPARREYCNTTIREGQLKAGFDRTSGDWNAFWEARDYWPKLKNIRAATLLVHGLNDWNVMPEHSVHVYQELKRRGVPAAIYLHQGGHGGGPTDELMNKWFTRFLYGIENGVEKGDHAWIVREDSARTAPTRYADYPNPAARAVRLHLTSGGNAIGGLTVGRGSTAREIVVDNVDSSGAALARMPQSPNRLLYATPTLTAPVHISGTATLRIRLASTTPAANLSAWLVALPYTEAERGRQNFSVVTRGWADPQNRNSLERSEPLIPGRFVEVQFTLQPDDQIIPAGKRLALMIFASDRDFTLWPPVGTALQVELGGTSLELPVVGGRDALARAMRPQP